MTPATADRAAERLHGTGGRPHRTAAQGARLGSAVNSTAAACLRQTVELLRGERADEAVIDLAELAVARRGEVVAHVTAAADLSDAQRTRLTEVLSAASTAIRCRSSSTSTRQLLGGLPITVGDEVIDGSISSRLTAAQTRLPD